MIGAFVSERVAPLSMFFTSSLLLMFQFEEALDVGEMSFVRHGLNQFLGQSFH